MNDESECLRWASAIEQFVSCEEKSEVVMVGVPLGVGALTPGRCDLAPEAVRACLAKMSGYNVVDDRELDVCIFDAGDIDIRDLSPTQCEELVTQQIRKWSSRKRLVIVLGGHNAVTLFGVHSLNADLSKIGLVTLDAHFDLRDTDCGLTNGNPIRWLIQGGLPGSNIFQIGIQPFANSRRASNVARENGIHVLTETDVHAKGLAQLVELALSDLATRVETIYVDVDIDVLGRSYAPGAPGARIGGASPTDLFQAMRIIGMHSLVRAVDFVECDPSRDVADVTSFTIARGVLELVHGFQMRGPSSSCVA